jgi:hypothetical protein
VAAEFAEGNVEAKFFDVPSDYQVDKIPFAEKSKK